MYKILLKAYEEILETQLDLANEKYNEYHIEILKKIEDIIVDYATTTKMSTEEILKELEELGAKSPMSILNDMYCAVEEENI